MCRPLRIQYPNAWYHVMNRGEGATRFSNLDGLAVIEKRKASEDLFHNTIEIEFSLGAARFASSVDIRGDVPLSTQRLEELNINELTDYAQRNNGYRNPSKPSLTPFKDP